MRFGSGRLSALAGVLTVLSAVAADAALAQQPGLPRTYQVQRVASPTPADGANFSQGTGGAGDLNADGEFDLVMGQLAQSPNGDGKVFVISGETGQLIDAINAPDAGGAGNRSNFAFPWVSKIGHNGITSSDLGSCAGGASGQLCPLPTIGAPDGIPEIVVGARGVDVGGVTDAGRVYVYDGATRALLKRIDAPPEDAPLGASRPGGSWFGRVALWPAGLPACNGNFGVGTCPPTTGPGSLPEAVRNGDMDAGGRPDLVVSASNNTETPATALPGSHCARNPTATCRNAGRVYVYRGEEIAGTSPGEILDGVTDGNVPNGSKVTETVRKIRNPVAQADNPLVSSDSEQFGNALTPIGDVGACTAAGLSPGERCPVASSTTTPDGKPEVVAGAHRVDMPVDNPDPAYIDVGAAFLLDGATGTVLHIYQHPSPQAGAVFGIPFHHEPASGDLGDTGLPDVPLPAAAQHTSVTAGGREYVMNGNFKASISNINFSQLDDPTPNTGENFGSGSAGVGDVVGGPTSPANELLVGGGGPFLGPANRELIGDAHFFNPAEETLLQTVPDPDQQGGSGFAESLVPLGDLNEDTFLDFAAGAWLYSGAAGVAEGRLYIFRSDNSPPPPPPATPRPRAAGPSRPPTLLAGRCANRHTGTDRGETINGTTAGDEIFGFGGDDLIESLSGEDCVDAGSGQDRLGGGAGRDSLLGQSGDDRLSGLEGNDRLFGGDGRDRLSGGSGRDLLVSGDGSDRLSGGRGSRDRLFGEGGHDRIRAGSRGRNVIDGGSGNDRINAANGRRDSVDCGSGRDTVRVDRIDGLRDCERVRVRGRRR